MAGFVKFSGSLENRGEQGIWGVGEQGSGGESSFQAREVLFHPCTPAPLHLTVQQTHLEQKAVL